MKYSALFLTIGLVFGFGFAFVANNLMSADMVPFEQYDRVKTAWDAATQRNWRRPLETAPEFERVLVWAVQTKVHSNHPDHAPTGVYDSGKVLWEGVTTGSLVGSRWWISGAPLAEPTHWMPLPDPPVSK